MDHAFKVKDHGFEMGGAVHHPFGLRTHYKLTAQMPQAPRIKMSIPSVNSEYRDKRLE